MKPLIQGRTPQERATHLHMAEIVYGVLCFLLFVCMVLGSTGCALAPHDEHIVDNAGHDVVIHVDSPHRPCAAGATACAVGTNFSEVYVSSAATWADDHEEYWHGVNKGFHTEWAVVGRATCARVTDPGTNKGWVKGDVMCVEYARDPQGNDVPGTQHVVRALPDSPLYYSAFLALGVS